MRKILYIGLILLSLSMTGCKENAPLQKVGMPVSICLPANEVKAANYAPRRAMGDPGKGEQFLFPHYLYIIVMKQNDDESWSKWQTVSRILTDADWQPKSYVGLLPTPGDSIYEYTEQIDLMLSTEERFDGRVYAVASAVELTFNKELDAITDLDDLLALTFNTSSKTVQENLQHIYASPYNLQESGRYFGSFSSKALRVPHVNMLLYHLAAKVDIKWNVADTMQINKSAPAEAVRLTTMKACNLYNGNAYCFRPMRNTVPSSPAYVSSDTIGIVSASDIGLWWEGRTYFYTIPYTVTGAPNYFPLQMLMETNESGDEYKPTLNLKIDTSAVFVPWLRANFNISKPLDEDEETIEVEVAD